MGHHSRQPLVSILLPAHNAEKTLGPCLSSIRRQTERRWECIVLDDGSTDRTLVAAREAAGDDSRIRIYPQSHQGLVATLNAGIGRCHGPLVARMDADDLMHRDRLAEQVALLETELELAAAGCHVRIFPRAGMGQGLREYERWINSIDGPQAVRRDAFVECPVAHPALTIRRALIESLGYRDEGWPEDYDLVLRLLERGHKVGMVTKRLLLWRHAPGRLSRASEVYGVERFTRCKAEFLCRTFLAAHDSYLLWGYGATGRALSRELSALGRQPSRVIDLHPGRLGNRIHGALVIPPEALPDAPRLPLLVSVAGEGPRREIREFLARAGLVETRDFVCAA
jgi:cellulose synthase/poly-beta-1,6-N-acetylglucosamine synthase-like glycosyltransferase